MLLQLRAGKTKDAEVTVKAPLAKHPNNVTLRLAWAEFLMATNAYVQAEKEALAVMHVDEKSAGAMLVLSHAYYAEKKYELSRFAAENARDVDPQNAEAYHQLGVLYLQKNQHAQALTAFRKATELRPDAYASQIDLSELLTEAGDFEGALVAAEAALAFVPNSDNARLVHANALRGVQRYRDAETEYQKLIDKNPDTKNPNTVRAIYNLAILYLDADIEGMELSQRLQKAVDEFNAFLKSNPPADEVALVQGYVTQAKRQIEAEEKRKDREAKKAAKKAASQPASTPAK
jgi:tetratricopeptide (TPR) repeat protein